MLTDIEVAPGLLVRRFLQETICVWRRAQLVMVAVGGSSNETPVEDDAAAMDSRAAALIP